MKVARKLFVAHGFQVYGWEYELLNPAKNPFFNHSVQKHGTAAATARALEAIHDDAKKRRSVLLFNGAPGYLSEAVAAVLRRREALLVHAWRRNVLDTLVCEVRDCFAHTTPTGKRAGAAGTLGWPVDARTGARSSACFEQRRSKRANSSAAATTAAAAAMGPTKAHLNISSLDVGLLPLDSPARLASFLRSRRLAATISLSTEDLSDFSLAAQSREEAQMQLRRSAAAWERALTAWGVPTNAEQLSRLLAAERDRATPHVITPHTQTISNVAEVEETLRRAGPAYAALVRTETG